MGGNAANDGDKPPVSAILFLERLTPRRFVKEPRRLDTADVLRVTVEVRPVLLLRRRCDNRADFLFTSARGGMFSYVLLKKICQKNVLDALLLLFIFRK